jgi:hypothetical protein
MPPPKEADLLLVVEDIMSIVKSDPEHAEKEQPVIELIVRQTMNIDLLKGALVHLCSELGGIVGDFKSEELVVISALQDMFCDIPDMN